jgi:putative two-component system response regulator
MTAILIVDDERPIREMLKQFLETKSYECAVAANASEARSRMEGQDFEVILCDINMPGGSGLEVIREVIQKGKETAPIMVTGIDDPLVVNKAFQIGAFDYITKPLDLNRVLISVTNALHRRELEMINRMYSHELEKKVLERTTKLRETTERLEETLDGVIDTIAFTLEKRDPYTSGHQHRVARLACGIAGKMRLPEDLIYGLKMASLIHDIGKIYVPSEILSKPGKLSEAEFEIIKTHPQVGYEILKRIEFPWPIAEITYQHHERINGSGYPRGLSGAEILLEAKILGVADVVEAMASHRPYRPALGIDKATEEISRNKGVLYEPEVAGCCLDLLQNDGFKLEERKEVNDHVKAHSRD